jgi:general secretion pathway protein I
VTAGRAPEAGFTLVETLVALAVLSLSAVAILGATEGHVRRVADLRARAAAQWAAENHLAELTLGLAAAPAPAPLLGHRFALQAEVAATADPDLRRVTVTAAETGGGARVRLTGFLRAGGAVP